MARLIYSAIASLDGYIEDKDGNFDWAAPDEEVHAFINDLERPVGTHLYGRRMYETMAAWETMHTVAADKIVYSRTLQDVSSARTRIERRFDPEVVRQLKASASGDIGIGGPELAAHAMKAGLIDEYLVFVSPVLVGGGKQALPDDVRARLELLGERRFSSGVVMLHYGIGT